MGFFGLGNVVSSLIDGHFDVGMGLYNDYRSRKSAKKSYNRQLSYSNSAHQREVQDLISAGLNPVLSAGGNGAASVSVASAGNPNMHRSSSYGQAINSALLMRNQNKLLEAQRNQAQSIADANKANAALTSAKTVEQKSRNVLELGKSEVFKGLPESAKYDVINATLYPNSIPGQTRGLASALLDGLFETGKRIGRGVKNLWQNSKPKSTEDAIDELIREIRNEEAGAQGGNNSAKRVKDDSANRETLKSLIKKREDSKESGRKLREYNQRKSRFGGYF